MIDSVYGDGFFVVKKRIGTSSCLKLGIEIAHKTVALATVKTKLLRIAV